MRGDELQEEISIELESIENTLKELALLRADVSGREPSNREKTAAAAFLAQFYGGIENILKRISRYYAIPLPNGDNWHIELFKRFCDPSFNPLPALFDAQMAEAMGPFRKFRHVVYHGYGFQRDWNRMEDGIEKVEDVYSGFKEKLSDYLHSSR